MGSIRSLGTEVYWCGLSFNQLPTNLAVVHTINIIQVSRWDSYRSLALHMLYVMGENHNLRPISVGYNFSKLFLKPHYVEGLYKSNQNQARGGI